MFELTKTEVENLSNGVKAKTMDQVAYLVYTKVKRDWDLSPSVMTYVKLMHNFELTCQQVWIKSEHSYITLNDVQIVANFVFSRLKHSYINHDISKELSEDEKHA